MKKVLFSIIAAALISAVPAAAQHSIEEGITFLNTAELKTIFGTSSFTLVNTLSPVEFKEKRISGSINAPLSHYADGRATLPADKERRLIFYCMGIK
jgi:rhodanese-related sulfurtransferase